MQYSLLFEITPALPNHAQSYLPGHISFRSPNKLAICLHQEQGETNEALKSRAEWQIKRELLRIHVLEGIIFESNYLGAEPPLFFGFTGTASTGWFQRPLNPELAKAQETWEPNIELKLLLWEKAQREISDVRLTYAYLYMICETSKVDMRWNGDMNSELKAVQEIKLIRDMLLHGDQPQVMVKKYLEKCGIPHERNVDNSQRHIKLAYDRLHVALPAVWRILLKDLGFDHLSA